MKIAMYAGTFDPPTLAHLDIIERASKLCDSLLVCVAVNFLKTQHLISLPERLELLTDVVKPFDNVKIVSTNLLLIDFAKKNQVDFLIRGLRSIDQFESEYIASTANRALSDIDTLFLMSRPEFRHINSCLVREIYNFGGRIDHLVPARINDHLEP
ncbi:MAG: pantetheine-phosphate adenylyltransferase [Candidatus Protochlamydia sp.]|nr:pantetheine-phosphate adenylyltransferase [Candidatus Protochlamydia sp.]